MIIEKPNPEDAPKYYQHYFSLVPENNLSDALENSMKNTFKFISSIPKEKEEHQYALDKWTIKEVFAHIIDTERIFAYRALRFSRKDGTDLPSFNQNSYTPNANTQQRTLAQIADEYKAVRQASITLFAYLTPDMLDFRGSSNKNPVTARSIGWMIAGHDIHHCNVIKEKYL